MSLPLPHGIFSVTSAAAFEARALEIFRFQARECALYGEYIRLLGLDPEAIRTVTEIPFMPVTFFRDHLIVSGEGRLKRFFQAAERPA